jgi:hypothetical protein
LKNPLEAPSAEINNELELPQLDYTVRNQRFGLLKHLMNTYDNTVLMVIAMNYFNNGAQSMVFMVIVNMYQESFFVSV